MSEAIPDSANEKNKSRGLWRPIVLITAIVAVLIVARVLGLGERLGDLQDWIEGLGFLGYLAYVGIYIAAVVAGIPGSAITIAGGALFGSAVGVILDTIGANVGAALAFLVARYFARDAIARWLSTKERFRRLDELTEQHGAMIVAITRLIPIFPFNILNYGFGLTRVRFFTYVFWSWLCMIPGTVLYVVGTDAFANMAKGQFSWKLIGIVAAALVLLTILGVFARRKLKSGGEGAEIEE